MAIFHCQAKSTSRGKGQSSVAAAAYRSGVRLTDERTGEVSDYSRKKGVEYSEIVTSEGVPQIERGDLWNMAEAAEKRKDAKTAREWELALPSELDERQRVELTREFAHALITRYGVAVDIAIHAPGKEGDQRNHHAHLLSTTRTFGPEGLGEKTRILDSPRTSGPEIEHMRQQWGELCNSALERAGHDVRIDHRALREQGAYRLPTRHMGPAATAMMRRGEAPDRTAEPKQQEALKPEFAVLEETTQKIAFIQLATQDGGMDNFRIEHWEHKREMERRQQEYKAEQAKRAEVKRQQEEQKREQERELNRSYSPSLGM